MGATGGGTSSSGMAAAIEANVVGTSSLFGRVPGTGLHDEDPGLRFYLTAGVPFPLFNHVYLTRLPREKVDARIREVRRHYGARRLPFVWSVGPFSRPLDLGSRLESHGLVRAEQLSGMAADLQALDEGIPFPQGWP